ncbi:hypothetical protein ES703_57331 [subsurface metagenome]
MSISLGVRSLTLAIIGTPTETRVIGSGLLRMIDFPDTSWSFLGSWVSRNTESTAHDPGGKNNNTKIKIDATLILLCPLAMNMTDILLLVPKISSWSPGPH